MVKDKSIIAVSLSLCGLLSCSVISTVLDSDDDTTPPATITTLYISKSTDTTATIIWLAPGNDNTTGRAAIYDIRKYDSSITVETWNKATEIDHGIDPGQSGTWDSLQVTGLDTGITWYFAIKTRDENENWSGLSNIAQFGGIDSIPPAKIVDLAIVASNMSSVRIAWTAPGDDSTVGVPAIYDIRMSQQPIDESNYGSAFIIGFDTAHQVAGSSEEFLYLGLEPNRDYFIAIKTVDERFNASPLSNVVWFSTIDPRKVIWMKSYGRSDRNEIALSVVGTTDGGLLVVGKTTQPDNPGTTDALVMKIDQNGTLKWEQTFGGSGDESFTDCTAGRYGEYVLVGNTTTFGAGGSDIYVVKVDDAGNVLWEKTFGGVKYDIAVAVERTRDGGFAIAGSTDAFTPELTAYLLKISDNGTLLWHHHYFVGGGCSSARGDDLTTMPDGSIALAWTADYGCGPLYTDAVMKVVEPSGEDRWTRGVGECVVENVGYMNSPDYLIGVVRCSDMPKALMRVEADGSQPPERSPIELTKWFDNLLIHAGTRIFVGGGTGGRGFVAEIDLSGGTVRYIELGGPSATFTHLASLGVTIVATGSTAGQSGDRDVLVAKIIADF